MIKRFGDTVRKLRLELGISQEELAERADLHRTYIAGIERGGRNITLRSAEKIARALKVSVSYLLAQAEGGGESV
jgi:transcriptional regulator with XRE-family HTH domain